MTLEPNRRATGAHRAPVTQHRSHLGRDTRNKKKGGEKKKKKKKRKSQRNVKNCGPYCHFPPRRTPTIAAIIRPTSNPVPTVLVGRAPAARAAARPALSRPGVTVLGRQARRPPPCGLGRRSPADKAVRDADASGRRPQHGRCAGSEGGGAGRWRRGLRQRWAPAAHHSAGVGENSRRGQVIKSEWSLKHFEQALS
jgi:hypothetical protein